MATLNVLSVSFRSEIAAFAQPDTLQKHATTTALGLLHNKPLLLIQAGQSFSHIDPSVFLDVLDHPLASPAFVPINTWSAQWCAGSLSVFPGF